MEGRGGKGEGRGLKVKGIVTVNKGKLLEK